LVDATGDAKAARDAWETLYDVLKFLVLPTECYHTGMEKKFEWKQSAKEDCQYYCSKCRGEVPKFTKRVHKGGLCSLLTQKVQGIDNLSVNDFVKAMKQSRKFIFHDDDAPPKGKESQIHAVCLQMVAGGIISFKVDDKKKIGTDKLRRADLSVYCPNVKTREGGRDVYKVSYRTKQCWKGFNLC